MKTIKKRLCAFMLSIYMVFGVVSTDYLEVQAFEWVIPAIGIEEALKALFLLFGVSVSAKVVGDNVDWGELKQDCITFQENQGNSAVAVSEWWNDVIHGSLNQASSCWSAFKEWLSSFTSSTSLNVDINNTIVSMCDILGYNCSSSITSDINPFLAYYNPTGNRLYFFSPVNNSSDFSYYISYNDSTSKYVINFSSACYVRFVYLTNNKSFSNNDLNLSSSGALNYNLNLYSNAIYLQDFWGDLSVNTSVSIHNIIGSVSDFDFDIYNPNILDEVSLFPSSATSTSIPDVVPLPWQNLGDDVSAINEKIDSIIDRINTGVLDIASAMALLQSILGVLTAVADGTLQPVIPDDETGDEPNIEDEVNQNIENTGFILTGLEKVFPFCIPFDLYAFMTLLVSDPVAPVIEFPIYNPVTDTNEIIEIDFSVWESVVILFRYIFDFLFIIGLLLMARALIGGGDSA